MKELVRVAIAALAVSATSVAEGATIIVPDDDPSIAAAVEGAGPGDVIQVRPGTYNESVRIQNGQTGLVIEGLGGVPKIAPARSDDAFRITRVTACSSATSKSNRPAAASG